MAGVALGCLTTLLVNPGYEATMVARGDSVKAPSRRDLAVVVDRAGLYQVMRLNRPLEAVVEELRGEVRLEKARGKVLVACRYADASRASRAAAELGALVGPADGALPTVTLAPGPLWRGAGFGFLGGLGVGALWTLARRRQSSGRQVERDPLHGL